MTATKKRRNANGDGTYRQRADGSWEGRITLPPGPDGKQRRKSVYAPTKEKARQKLRPFIRQLEDHGNVASTNPTVNKWIDFWLTKYCKVRPKTRDSYVSKLRYVKDAIGTRRLQALQPEDIRKIHTLIEVERGLSPSTANNTHRVFSKVLKDAIREGVLAYNVCERVDPPARAVAEVSTLDPDQARELILAVAGDRNGSRWIAALLTGARQGELLGLTWDRVDFASNIITLDWQLQRINWKHGCLNEKADITCGRKRGTDCPSRMIYKPADWEHRYLYDAFWMSRPKTRSGWREIPMPSQLRAVLLNHRERTRHDPNPGNFVWTADPKHVRGSKGLMLLDGKCIDPSKDNHAWHALLERFSLPQMRLHDARHTAVTLLFDLGVPEAMIQAIVGQSVVAVTRGYRRRSAASLAVWMQKLGDALDPAQPATLTLYRDEPMELSA